MDLANIIIPSKTVSMEYPGYPDLAFKVAYLTREEILKLRSKATSQKFNKKTRQPEEDLDSDLFQDLWIEAVLKGWSGFKYSYLEKMIPVDTTKIPKDEYKEGEGFFEYTKSNASVFMKNCTDFDNWITGQLEDVENFTQDS